MVRRRSVVVIARRLGGQDGGAAEVVLEDGQREVLERWARRPKSCAGAGAALPDRAGGRGRSCRARRSPGGSAVARQTVGKWRGRFAASGSGWAARRAAAGQAARDQRRGRGAGDREDARRAAARRDALVDAFDGGRDRDEPERGEPDLARLRAEAAPDRDVQALSRPAVHRQGAGRRRAVSQPARGRGRALRGREVPDPGARPYGAGAAADARGARSATPTTTSATAPRTSTPPSTRPPAT